MSINTSHACPHTPRYFQSGALGVTSAAIGFCSHRPLELISVSGQPKSKIHVKDRAPFYSRRNKTPQNSIVGQRKHSQTPLCDSYPHKCPSCLRGFKDAKQTSNGDDAQRVFST